MITPMDIERAHFSKSFRGFRAQEVEAFLRQIQESFEALYRENSILKDKVAQLEERLAEYRDMEETIRQAAATARSNAEAIQAQAEKKADLIIAEAYQRRRAILAAAERERSWQEENLARLHGQEQAMLTRLRSLFRLYQEILSDYEEQRGLSSPELPRPAQEETPGEDVAGPEEQAQEAGFPEGEGPGGDAGSVDVDTEEPDGGGLAGEDQEEDGRGWLHDSPAQGRETGNTGEAGEQDQGETLSPSGQEDGRGEQPRDLSAAPWPGEAGQRRVEAVQTAPELEMTREYVLPPAGARGRGLAGGI